jgi:hypothetical protein
MLAGISDQQSVAAWTIFPSGHSPANHERAKWCFFGSFSSRIVSPYSGEYGAIVDTWWHNFVTQSRDIH